MDTQIPSGMRTVATNFLWNVWYCDSADFLEVIIEYYFREQCSYMAFDATMTGWSELYTQ